MLARIDRDSQSLQTPHAITIEDLVTFNDFELGGRGWQGTMNEKTQKWVGKSKN